MNKKKLSVDGFTPRRQSTSGLRENKNRSQTSMSTSLRRNIGKPPVDNQDKTINIKADIKNSLSEIDKLQEKSADISKKLEKINKKRLQKGKKPLSKSAYKFRKIRKIIFSILIVAALAFVVVNGYRILNTVNKTFNGNFLGIFQKQRLKEDSGGRTNILVFGTSPEGWDGADLADSIMVISYNQNKGDIYTVSLPRDLYVKHTCRNWLGTTAGKLNESYGCGKMDATGGDEKTAEAAGRQAMADVAKTVLGLDIHYQVHANWKVLTEVVDNIGGIDVKVETYDGSPQMYDVATKVRYKNGEVAHMNGERALAFSRARGSAGGYGLSGGNFDRERNQQKVFKAIVDKVNQSNLADINRIMNIMESLGNNISTNFETPEIQALVDLAKNYQSDKVKSLPLVDLEDGTNLMKTGNISGASVVIPAAGTFDYDDIKSYIKKNIYANDITQENAKLVVLNGTEVDGLARTEKNKLEEQGFTVVNIGNTKNRNYDKNKIYVLNNKEKTVNKLTEIYGVGADKDNIPAEIKEFQADIIVVIGKS